MVIYAADFLDGESFDIKYLNLCAFSRIA